MYLLCFIYFSQIHFNSKHLNNLYSTICCQPVNLTKKLIVYYFEFSQLNDNKFAQFQFHSYLSINNTKYIHCITKRIVKKIEYQIQCTFNNFYVLNCCFFCLEHLLSLIKTKHAPTQTSSQNPGLNHCHRDKLTRTIANPPSPSTRNPVNSSASLSFFSNRRMQTTKATNNIPKISHRICTKETVM